MGRRKIQCVLLVRQMWNLLPQLTTRDIRYLLCKKRDYYEIQSKETLNKEFLHHHQATPSSSVRKTPKEAHALLDAVISLFALLEAKA